MAIYLFIGLIYQVVEYRLKDGASELIQLQDLGATIVEMTRK